MAALSSSRCLFNSRTALHRVFISTEAATAQRTRQLAATSHHALQTLSLPPASGQVRTYAGPQGRSNRSPPRGGRGPNTGSNNSGGRDDSDGPSHLYSTAENIEKAGRDRMPQDHEIKDPKIMVMENGSIAGPLSTKYVMSKLDEKTESLRMIKPYIPVGTSLGKDRAAVAAASAAANARGEDPAAAVAALPEARTTEAQYATCEIVNKFEEYVKKRQKREDKKTQAKPKTKELELSWGIGEHDLQTKMRRCLGFLDKGMKVEAVLGQKKGGAKAAAEEMQALVKRVRAAALEQGARESKPAEGELGSTYRLYFEGKKKA